MIVTRISARVPDVLENAAQRITTAIHEHPLATHLDALILIGTGEADQVRPGDPTPRVVVPLVFPNGMTAIGLAQVAYAHAVVLLDASEASHLPPSNALRILAGLNPETRRAFLGQATLFESLEAQSAIREHPTLRAALAMCNPASDRDLLDAPAVAEAIFEAIVAVTPPDPQVPDRIG